MKLKKPSIGNHENKWKSGKVEKVEKWKSGKVEKWKSGKVEKWE